MTTDRAPAEGTARENGTAQEHSAGAARVIRVALTGNPNTGKTSLFNRLTGLRSRTANYPGVTVEIRRGVWTDGERRFDLTDLPGLYSLDALSPEETVARRFLETDSAADVVVLVADSTNVQRSLYLASEVRELQVPLVVALNLSDAARAEGIRIDVDRLSRELGCPVVSVSARTGEGLSELSAAVVSAAGETPVLPAPSIDLPVVASEPASCASGCSRCAFAARYDWAEQTARASVDAPAAEDQISAADRLLTHPVIGPVVFLALMAGMFFLIFSLADVPMTLVDTAFASVGDFVGGLFPAGPVHPVAWAAGTVSLALLTFAGAYRLAGISWTRLSGTAAVAVASATALLPPDELRSLVVEGIIGGVGGVVIFLPQICILFFVISLLEDSGYMARAAFVMERFMRFVGLPGRAFVPMLSAHACAIPGIMATRTIENRRDRLVTILVLPLLTCSARLPVYSMVAALLFAGSPGTGALVFTGAYILGITAALMSAWVLKKSILPGDTEPLVLELPPYRLPALRSALLTVWDRARVFLQNAGTAILMFSVILWALAAWPRLPESDLPSPAADQVAALRTEAAQAAGDRAEELSGEADRILRQHQLSHSFAGRIGRAVEPVFRPLGFDWKINVGVISSFAAREVVVSTLAIVYGLGEDGIDDEASLVETLRRQKRDDGRPVFSTATCLSLLVFYVLAMQCLPTQAVTRRETGTWKWALLQFAWMTVLAWTAALITYQTASVLTSA